MELPAMAQSLLGGDDDDMEEKRFRPVVDLDVFFTDMYNYHYNKGLPAIMLTQFCTVLSLGFTVAFSVFLLGFIDWNGLMACHDEGSCHDLHAYIVTTHFGFSSIFGFIIMGYCFLFTGYWVFRCVTALQTVSSAMDMEKFYREKLGISLHTLQGLSWNEVVQRLIRLHEHKIHRVAVKDRLTEHDVVCRIMRKENYMVALINKGVLDLRLPWWASPFLGSERLFLTKSLEWSLYFCVLQHIFNDQFNVSSVFLRDVKGLQSRFMVVGLVHFLLLPFMLVFMTVHFFLQNAQQFHSSKSYLGPRQWSPLALWTFREFNELLHVFEARINKSYAPANEYLQSFSNQYLSIVARCGAYVCGSFVAVLLLASVIDEAILLYVHTSDHNLLWYLGICSAAYAGARSVVPDETKTPGVVEQEELLDQITAHTHYRGEKWTGRAHTTEVRDEVLELFPYKAKLFFVEILSVLFTPVVLCFSLPNCAPAILEFIREHTAYIDGVGAVCDYCTFDLDKYGDEDYACVPEPGHVEVGRRPANGKLEQSFLNFQRVHPDWQGGGETGRGLVSRLNTFRVQRENERDMMMSAALQNSMSLHMLPMGSQQLVPGPGQMPLQSGTSPIFRDSASAIHRQDVHGDGSLSTSDPLPKVNSAPASDTGPSLSSRRLDPAHQHSIRPSQQCVDPAYNDTDFFRSMGSMRRVGGAEGDLTGRGVAPSMYGHSYYAGGSAFLSRSNLGGMSQSVGSGGGMPSILRSILKRENIDYENDFYWLSKFQQERRRDPVALEQSLLQGSVSLIGGSAIYGGSSASSFGVSSGREPRHQEPREVQSVLRLDSDILMHSVDSIGAPSPSSSDGSIPAFSEVEQV